MGSLRRDKTSYKKNERNYLGKLTSQRMCAECDKCGGVYLAPEASVRSSSRTHWRACSKSRARAFGANASAGSEKSSLMGTARPSGLLETCVAGEQQTTVQRAQSGGGE